MHMDLELYTKSQGGHKADAASLNLFKKILK